MARRYLCLVPLCLAAACGAPGSEAPTLVVGEGDATKLDGKFDASAEAVFLDFEFDATVRHPSSWNVERVIEDQLLYTIGHLNGDRSVGRLDRLELTDVRTERDGDGYVTRYHARLPVAWGRRNDVPASYEFRLPIDMSYAAQEAFADKYGHSCVDWGAHDVTPGSMWYYFRPKRSGCSLSEDDALRTTATVTLSEINTSGKYPEYDRVWEDGVLKVVAIFGKYEDGATEASDAGIAAYNRFVRELRQTLSDFELVTTPEEVPSYPGIAVPDITFEATLAPGRRIEVVALLVDNVRTAGLDFDRRYESLTPDADLIAYNGHAGLGANIRALARKGAWRRGQYAIVFMNGCDTYAYVDDALFAAHAEVNPDDPRGTKYLDIVTNAMPSFFRSMANATLVLIEGLMQYDEPLTYERMFQRVDSSQVILVTGEEDNTFVPGGTEEPGTEDWPGLYAEGDLKRGEVQRYETPALASGVYLFQMEGRGDADLYVRAGEAPTLDAFDCRPFTTGSEETCKIELTRPAVLHVMVRGWTDASYRLEGRRN